MKASRFLLALLGAGILGTMVLGLQAAQEPTNKDTPPNVGAIREKLQLEEQRLKDQFLQFQTSILKLKQRLERSGKKDDLDRAKNLDKVLELIRNKTVTTQFERLADFLNKSTFGNIGDISTAAADAKRLADDLREIINLMQQSSSASKITQDRRDLEAIIAAITQAIKIQTTTRIQTENDVTEIKELKSLQGDANAKTKDILDKLNKYGQGAEAKDAGKGQSKPGGKGDGKNGEAKDMGKGGESGKGKEGDGADKNKPSEAKGGDGKGDPKGAKESQPAEAKGGKGGEAGAKGDPKGGKGGEAGAKGNPGGKDGDKKEGGAKGNEDKNGAKPSEAKGSEGNKDPKKEAGQPSESKSGKGGDSKEAGAKGSKGGDSKPSDSKPGDSKGGKPGDSKGGESSKGQSDSKPGGDQGGDPGAKDQQPKQDNQPQDVSQSKKRVQDADYNQQQAQKKISDKKPKDAVKDQDEAIDNLEKAKKKLEDLLRQMREEELERILAALQARCEKMLIMQMEVLAGTETVYGHIEKSIDKKPDRVDKIESNKLSDKEKDIVLEASKAIEMLEAEGSAVAFPEVFQQIREDMKHVQRRLDITDVGQVTQAIEKDIIDTLKEMIDALKKAQEEINNKKNPKAGKPPPPNPNADQKLLDQIAELKMIRSMQLRVNARTTTYGRMYPGEQAQEPNIRGEVVELGRRQERIFEVTNRIAKGDNK